MLITEEEYEYIKEVAEGPKKFSEALRDIIEETIEYPIPFYLIEKMEAKKIEWIDIIDKIYVEIEKQ